MKRIVAERPETSFFSVDVDTRFAHCSVEQESDFLVGGNIETGAIPSGSDIWKTSGTSGFQ